MRLWHCIDHIITNDLVICVSFSDCRLPVALNRFTAAAAAVQLIDVLASRVFGVFVLALKLV